MIHAELIYSGKQIVGFNICGHAYAEQYGKDIYCASISAVSDMAFLGINEETSGQLEYKQEEGLYYCMIDKDQHKNIKAQAILRSLESYLIEFEKEYSQFLRLSQSIL